jgi:hypothetical protein
MLMPVLHYTTIKVRNNSTSQTIHDVVNNIRNTTCSHFYLYSNITYLYFYFKQAGQCMQHEWGRRGMHIGYWRENQKRPLGRARRGWVDNIKMDLRWDGMLWIGLICLRIGTSGGLL